MVDITRVCYPVPARYGDVWPHASGDLVLGRIDTNYKKSGERNSDGEYDDDPIFFPECVAESVTIRGGNNEGNFTHMRRIIKLDADWNAKYAETCTATWNQHYTTGALKVSYKCHRDPSLRVSSVTFPHTNSTEVSGFVPDSQFCRRYRGPGGA